MVRIYLHSKNIYLKLISAEGSGSEGAGEAEEITPSEDENTSSEEDTSSEESIEGEPTSQTSEDESTDPQAA